MIVPLRFIIRAPILRDKPKQIAPEKSTKRGVFGQNRLRTKGRSYLCCQSLAHPCKDLRTVSSTLVMQRAVPPV